MNGLGLRRVILIVEDSEACAITLQIALESLPGIEVEVASSVKTALGYLAATEDCLAAVVTDLQLPGLSGMDLLARLRSDARFAAVPVLVISGDSDPGMPKNALLSGADAFFTKPYSPTEIRRKLQQLMRC